MTSPTTPTDDTEDNGLFNVFAKFNLTLDKLSAQLDRQARNEQRRLAMLPNYVPVLRMSTPGAAVTDVQDFGGPQPGRQWIVRLLAAFASPLAPNAAVVTWYVGQNMPGPAAGQLPSTMARWQFASVPAMKDLGGQIKVLPGEKLLAGLTGIPASSSISLIVAIEDEILYGAQQVVSLQ